MSGEARDDQSQQPSEQQAGDNVCECPEVHLAADAVRLAKMELEKAQKFYDEVCRQAADKIKTVRETTVGEVLDCTLEKVKKHPAPSLIISAAMGFYLGRWFQKLFKKW